MYTMFLNLNNSVKNELILIIFGTQNTDETSRQKIVDLSTSPIKYSHCNLRNLKAATGQVLMS